MLFNDGSGIFVEWSSPAKQEEVAATQVAPKRNKDPVHSLFQGVSNSHITEVCGSAMWAAGHGHDHGGSCHLSPETRPQPAANRFFPQFSVCAHALIVFSPLLPKHRCSFAKALINPWISVQKSQRMTGWSDHLANCSALLIQEPRQLPYAPSMQRPGCRQLSVAKTFSYLQPPGV